MLYSRTMHYTDEEIKQFTGTAGSVETIENARIEFGVSVDLASFETV